MVDSKLVSKFKESFDHENRDFAFIALPGMGLSSLLRSLSKEYRAAWIPYASIQNYTTKSFRQPRYLLHALLIDALSALDIGFPRIETDARFSTNLFKYLELANGQPEDITVLLLFDEFSKLDKETAKLFCDEMKNLHDQRSEFKQLSALRFIIGGAIDFNEIYDTTFAASVSPATNFRKFYPQDFLLSSDEMNVLLRSINSHFASLPESVKNLIYDWTNGYVHYVVHFCDWISQLQHDEDKIDTQLIVRSHMKIMRECA